MKDNIQIYNDLLHECSDQMNQMLEYLQFVNSNRSKGISPKAMKVMKELNHVVKKLEKLNSHISWYFCSSEQFCKKVAPYQEKVKKIQREIDELMCSMAS